MKITPTRTMRLGGKRVEAGKPVDVPEADAVQALRHGWAVPSQAKARKADVTGQPDAPAADQAAEPAGA